MSGSGGFYKYRCKYFLSHDCPNWVFVNNAPCADCCAAGRDTHDPGQDLLASHHPFLYGSSPEFEIGVPVFQDGLLRYTFAGMLSSYEPGADFASWITLRPPLDGSLPALPSPYPPPPPQSPRHLHQSQPSHHLLQQQQQQQQQQQPPQNFAQLDQQQLQHSFIQEHPSAAAAHFRPHKHLQNLQQLQLQHEAAYMFQGGDQGWQGARMQLPPHAASKAFPVSTAAGVGDTMLAGSPGLLSH
ncbi:hypothetical protein SCUCBS95973_007186 [Sporothrix curviconia]|uniref:Uncharacterized protein n=1 Tax=Sporothrix curviconia TaxID=1260050 RepID=A0ABP0CD11_9PEZI